MTTCTLCVHMRKAWCEKTGKYPYQDEAERCVFFESDPEAVARQVWMGMEEGHEADCSRR